MFEILTLSPAIVKPAEINNTPPVAIAADDDSWIMSDEEADRLADESRGYDMIESGSWTF